MRFHPLLLLGLFVVTSGCGGSGSGSSSATTTFRVLETPSDGTIVNNVSSDGRVIAGKGTNSSGAVYWIDDVPQALLPSDDLIFSGGYVSADGKKVASSADNKPTVQTIGGSTNTVALPAGFESGISRHLGKSVLLAEAFKSPGTLQSYLVQNGTLRLLPPLVPEAFAQALRISDSDNAVIGTSDDKPVRWTNLSNPTVQALVQHQGVARDVSANGEVVVGYYSDGVRWVGFRWTPQDGAVDLGQLPNKMSLVPTAVSADGSVVVGNAYETGLIDESGQPFIWTEKTGLRPIASLPGFTDPVFQSLESLSVADVSANGRVIVGSAKTSGGNPKGVGWVVRLGSL